VNRDAVPFSDLDIYQVLNKAHAHPPTQTHTHTRTHARTHTTTTTTTTATFFTTTTLQTTDITNHHTRHATTATTTIATNHHDHNHSISSSTTHGDRRAPLLSWMPAGLPADRTLARVALRLETVRPIPFPSHVHVCTHLLSHAQSHARSHVQLNTRAQAIDAACLLARAEQACRISPDVYKLVGFSVLASHELTCLHLAHPQTRRHSLRSTVTLARRC
jgi:hypothetical protein